MRKLLNLLLVKRAEIEDRWWNRLFNVFLWGTSALILIFAFLLILNADDYKWVTYDPIAFSLEPNYQQVVGKEFPCNWSFDTTGSAGEPMKSVIQCNSVEISLTDMRRYGDLYDLAKKELSQTDGIDDLNNKYIQICKDEISSQNLPLTYSKTLTPDQMAEFKCFISKEKADPSYSQHFDKYQNDLKNIATIKVARNIHYGDIFRDVTFMFLIPVLSMLVWILFWSQIVYRSILYIAFGSKKSEVNNH